MFLLSSFLPRHVFLPGLGEADTVTGDLEMLWTWTFILAIMLPHKQLRVTPPQKKKKTGFLCQDSKSPISLSPRLF